nr:phytochrome, two-component sensor histidine kinase [uncultured bacterium]
MKEGSSELYPEDLKLIDCDKEPIHIIGKIQSHGYLLVCDATTLEITYCSENIDTLFNKSISELLGSSLESLFEDHLINDLKNATDHVKLSPVRLHLNNEDILLITHKTGNSILLEFENFQESQNAFDYQIQLSEVVTRLSEQNNEQQMCDVAADLIKKLYDYNRVMIYKFDENWDGIVISEARDQGMETWLGLRYPASDIPKQARDLFLKQGVRIISDVNEAPVSILAHQGVERNNPVDLTLSELRGTSPIHIEYLQNMNVGASLTAAIIFKGTLWGLIACHHYTPKFVNYYERQSCKFLTQVFSSQLLLSTTNTLLEKVNESANLRNTLMKQISENWDISEGLVKGDVNLLDLNDASGAALYIDDIVYRLGDAPEERDILKFILEIKKRSTQNLFQSNEFILESDGDQDLIRKASGVLCVFISKFKNDCLIWFKPEKKSTVNWAGNPDKSFTNEKNFRISPRKSFEKWSVSQEKKSEPWQDYEVEAASVLRQNISEIILKKYEEVKSLNNKLTIAYEDLETFSYSVAHDLRAPLRGIDGFTQILKEDYYEELDDFGKSAIETILDSASNMNQLIDNILEFSKVTQYETERAPFDLAKITNDILDFLNVKLNHPKLKITIDANMPMLNGDAKMVTQLMQNLLTNAIKYTGKSENPHIEVGSTLLNGDLFYYVKDNGIGFDQKHEHRIFKLFNRLVGEEYEGSGIGLAIVARIVKKHSGIISVKSAVNEGSTFFFNLG